MASESLDKKGGENFFSIHVIVNEPKWGPIFDKLIVDLKLHALIESLDQISNFTECQ